MENNEKDIEEIKVKVDKFMLKFGLIASAGSIGAILGILAYNNGWLPWLQ